MKVLAIVLLCAFAAVQGRTAVKVIDNSSSEVELENQPWVVHLRYAIRTSGFLETSTGSLITARWVLTGNHIIAASFIWVRIGVKYVLQPSLVIETSQVQTRQYIGLINLGRNIEFSAGIASISLALPSETVNGVSCGFGLSANGGPGENLQCSTIAVEESEDDRLIGPSGKLSKYDTGAALVSNGEQIAVLISVEEESATYTKFDFDLLKSISEVTGLPFPEQEPESSESSSASGESGASSSSSESGSNSSESEEESRVKFVNF